MVKQRHKRLTEQLNKEERCRGLVLFHAKNNVRVEIVKPAVLPYLIEGMERSGQMASWYLNEAQERMKKIADTIGFLSAWSLSKFEVFHDRMQTMSAKTRCFVAAHQCNFDPCHFIHLGREIQKIIENSKECSKFLS